MSFSPILNPAPGLQQKASKIDSTSVVLPPLSSIALSLSPPHKSILPLGQAAQHMSRLELPSIRHVESLGHLSQPTARISAQQNPSSNLSLRRTHSQTKQASLDDPSCTRTLPTGLEMSEKSLCCQGSVEQKRAIRTATSAGQNGHQLMTLDTASGPGQLPVDVQSTSILAENRRRNIRASERFRKRKKENEKEALFTIARLEEEHKEAALTITRLKEELKERAEYDDFHKRQCRDLVQTLLSMPGSDRIFPGPLSLQRPSGTSTILLSQPTHSVAAAQPLHQPLYAVPPRLQRPSARTFLPPLSSDDINRNNRQQ